MPNAVRIERNPDGSYSAYIYAECIYTGSYEECERELSFHNEPPSEIVK
jgi:hypothetical protein